MYQLQVQPAYALVIHKIQSLTIRRTVHGCLEGVFAQGQIYVLISRVTDSLDFHAIGLPPMDLLDAVAQAWREAGLDVDACIKAAAAVTGEWEYKPSAIGAAPERDVWSRLRRVHVEEKRTRLKARTLAEILNPQPRTTEVLQRLLAWIDRADRASQAQVEPPVFETAEGNPIFPTEDDDEWWLTE